MVTYHVSCAYNNFLPHRLSFNSIKMEITAAAALAKMIEKNSLLKYLKYVLVVLPSSILFLPNVFFTLFSLNGNRIRDGPRLTLLAEKLETHTSIEFVE